MKYLLLAIVLIFAGAASAQTWREPQRGTAERAALMNAVRPLAEQVLGPPVQFVVRDLRVRGDVGFAVLEAQRPGGVPIDITATPHFRSGQYDPEGGDPTEVIALYTRSAGTWAVADWSYAAQDVWWSDPKLCSTWGPVTPEVCP